jgi:hypothetical protein
MPPSDPRLRPALERALPADSVGYTDWRHDGRLHEALFGDELWHWVTVKARWLDRHQRPVIQLEWNIDAERWGECYLADPEKVREG